MIAEINIEVWWLSVAFSNPFKEKVDIDSYKSNEKCNFYTKHKSVNI